MPDVIGLRVDDARTTLAAEGASLVTVVGDDTYHAIVFDQTPSPGEGVSPSHQVVLRAALPPETEQDPVSPAQGEVPDVRGYDVPGAMALLQRAGFYNVSVSGPDSLEAHVFAQTPPPGEFLAGETPVFLESRLEGDEAGQGNAITMPDLVGLPVSVAQETMASLDVFEVYVSGAAGEAAVVTAQRPLPGYEVTRSMPVFLEGEERLQGGIDVPDVGGMSRQEAVRILQQRVGGQVYVTGATGPDAVVVSQSPLAGESVAPNTPTTIVMAPEDDQKGGAGPHPQPGPKPGPTPPLPVDPHVMPDVVGMTVSDAKRVLIGINGVEVKVDGVGDGDSAVRWQRPDPDTQIDATWHVVLGTGSQGARTVALPRVVGMTVGEALRVLRDAGLNGVLEGAAGQDRIVATQQPQPPATLGRGARVRLGLAPPASQGPIRVTGFGRVKMPDVVGMYLVHAVEELKGLGLGIKVSGKAVTDALVIAQHPIAGDPVVLGQRVRLTVDKTEVPDLRGLMEPAAEARLRARGLHLAPPLMPANDLDLPQRPIHSQSPVAGEVVDKGTAVRVSTHWPDAHRYASPAGVSKVPNIVGRRLSGALRELRVAGGYEAVFYEASGADWISIEELKRFETAGLQPVVASQAPLPGTELERGGVVHADLDLVPVPDLIGNTLSEATAATRAARFQLRTKEDSPRERYIVVAQEPPAASLQRMGSIVTVRAVSPNCAALRPRVETAQRLATGYLLLLNQARVKLVTAEMIGPSADEKARPSSERGGVESADPSLDAVGSRLSQIRRDFDSFLYDPFLDAIQSLEKRFSEILAARTAEQCTQAEQKLKNCEVELLRLRMLAVLGARWGALKALAMFARLEFFFSRAEQASSGIERVAAKFHEAIQRLKSRTALNMSQSNLQKYELWMLQEMLPHVRNRLLGQAEREVASIRASHTWADVEVRTSGMKVLRVLEAMEIASSIVGGAGALRAANRSVTATMLARQAATMERGLAQGIATGASAGLPLKELIRRSKAARNYTRQQYRTSGNLGTRIPEAPVRNLAGRTAIPPNEGMRRASKFRLEHKVGGGRNVAVADVQIVGKKADSFAAASGKHSYPASSSASGHKSMFRSRPSGREGTRSRRYDAEPKVLDKIAREMKLTPESRGVIRLFSEKRICQSCELDVIKVFKRRFPRIQVIISSATP